MSGLLGERVVCVVNVFCCFLSVTCSTMGGTGYNTDVNDRRCAGGFFACSREDLGRGGVLVFFKV